MRGFIPKKRHMHDSNAGLTLIEIMISLSIMAILFVMMSTALYYPRWLVTAAELKQNAINAGTDALEQVFSQNYFDIPSSGSFSVDYSGSYEVNGQTFTATVTPATTNDATLPGSMANAQWKHIILEIQVPDRPDDPVILETFRSSIQ